MKQMLKPALLFGSLLNAHAQVQVEDHLIRWDGTTPPPPMHIAIGDRVTWETTFPSDYLAVVFPNMTLPYVDNQCSLQFMNHNYYSYGIAAAGAEFAQSGVVNVQNGYPFNQWSTQYELMVGDLVRWNWNGTAPQLPSMFEGFCNEPGVSYQGAHFYDYAFLVPGQYSWFHDMNEYKFNVHRISEEAFFNIAWTSDTNRYIEVMEYKYLTFYDADNKKHNVRLVGANSTGAPDLNSPPIWVSNDIVRTGEEVTLFGHLNPGLYFAFCDYHPNAVLTIHVTPLPPQPNPGGGSGNGGRAAAKLFANYLPNVVQAVELSLFMIGILGFGSFLKDQLTDDNKDHHHDKKSDSPPPPPPNTGPELASFALHRAKARVAAMNK